MQRSKVKLDPAVSAVNRASANYMPCKRYRRKNALETIAHMKRDNCQECTRFVLQAEKETRMMLFLRDSRN